ncbi:BTAD domain-containing putative transcriptional regulator [Sedimentibacter sp.]|uniref:AfsR/SARP family transcriptional regulator n=1 Tax=Sedimentibacter sp. TaxID=1960295 RepID=UPI0028A730DF|nr:BTAD domain-containing putative transcriptional regulator [Sedimentibacter sp.]
MLNICFLGKSKIEYNGESLQDKLGSKAIALICLLALKENGYLSREKIVGYLWPDSNIEAARYNLRYNLWLIKKNIGSDEYGNSFLNVDNEFCCINKKYDFKCDILEVMKFKPSDNDSVEGLLKLKRLFRGDLLEGCFFKKCEEFNDVILFERINFERYKVKILKRLIDLYENEDLFDSVIEVIKEILEIEPYDEEMVLKLMDTYVKCGKRVAAITYYNNYSNGLAGSLGISPSNELKKKYNEIKALANKDLCYDRIDEYKNISGSDKKVDRMGFVIYSDCLKYIEYFWIADVLDKLVKLDKEEIFSCLNNKELWDLGYIQFSVLKFCSEQPDIIQGYRREVIDVCIVNAFIKLLKHICERQNLTIIIKNSSNLDNISANVLAYLKRLQINELKLMEE